ncbi:MAG: diguanylate cyclase [Thermacetogeniaceae bacterium]
MDRIKRQQQTARTQRMPIGKKPHQSVLDLQVVFQAMPDLFFKINADGTCQELLPTSSGSDLTMEEVLGKRARNVSEKLSQQFQQAIERVLQTQSLTVIEYSLTMEQETAHFEARFFPLLENQVVVAIRNITERKQSEERLKYLSFHDIMTGLYNRAFFEEELKRLDTKRQMPLSIIVGDIDGLKLVNDTLGHQQGDKLIVKIAGIIRMSCRSEDIVCRWGGDEFAILLPKTDKDVARRICDRIRKSCTEDAGEPFPLSVSLGVATKKDSHQNIEGVIREAEDMMYKNKLKSNHTRFSAVAYFQRSMGAQAQDTLEHGRCLQDLVLSMENLPAAAS